MKLTDQERKNIDLIMKVFSDTDYTIQSGGLGWDSLKANELTKNLQKSELDFYNIKLRADGFLDSAFSPVSGKDFYGATFFYKATIVNHGSLSEYYKFKEDLDRFNWWKERFIIMGTIAAASLTIIEVCKLFLCKS